MALALLAQGVRRVHVFKGVWVDCSGYMIGECQSDECGWNGATAGNDTMRQGGKAMQRAACSRQLEIGAVRVPNCS